MAASNGIKSTEEGQQSYRGRKGKKPLAFTLVELLSVLAIVSVLTGLLLPALGRAKVFAKRVGCVGNLKQWGLATQMYVHEHDDYLPPDGQPNPSLSATNSGWYVALPREMGMAPYHTMAWRTNLEVNPGRSVWICPANSRRSNGRNLFHYCLNENVNGTGAKNGPVRLGAMAVPSKTVWLFDSKNLPAVGSWSFVFTNLHQAGAQFLFLDGRVQRVVATDRLGETNRRAPWGHPDLVWVPER